MDLNALLNPATLIFLVPVLGVVAAIAGGIMKHRERMAMIERGMNPDQVKLERQREKAQLASNDIRR